MKTMAILAILSMVSVTSLAGSEAAAGQPRDRSLQRALTRLHHKLRKVLPAAAARRRLTSLVAKLRKLVPATRAALAGATSGAKTGSASIRVNNLANLEATLNIIGKGMEILGMAWGGPTMIMGFMRQSAAKRSAMRRVLFGAAGVTGGLATPGAINWLVASARDANLFARTSTLLRDWTRRLRRSKGASLVRSLASVIQRVAQLSIPRVGWEVLVH